MADYIGHARVVMEDLALAGLPISLDEMNLYIFCGLRPEYRSLTLFVAVSGQAVTLVESVDFLGAHDFIHGDGASGSFPATFLVQRGGGSSVGGHGRQNRGDSNFSNRGRGGQQKGGRNGARGRSGQTQCQICGRYCHAANTRYNRYDPPP